MIIQAENIVKSTFSAFCFFVTVKVGKKNITLKFLSGFLCKFEKLLKGTRYASATVFDDTLKKYSYHWMR